MGYRIEYDDGAGKALHQKKRRPSRWLVTGIFLFVFVFLVNCFWPRGKGMLEEILWPGDKAQTVAALETMAEELGAGKTLGEAVEGFCREILDGETLSLS